MFKPYSLLLLLSLFGVFTDSHAQSTPTYQYLTKISLPTGDGKWDYLKMDGERERLFVSHFDRVHVIDLTTDKQIGEITGLKGVHGIGLAKDLNKGYITNGADNTVTVFDYNTFKVLQTIPVNGKKPGRFSPRSQRTSAPWSSNCGTASLGTNVPDSDSRTARSGPVSSALRAGQASSWARTAASMPFAVSAASASTSAVGKERAASNDAVTVSC